MFGSVTRRNTCQPLAPSASAASSVFRCTLLMASAVRRTAGGTAYQRFGLDAIELGDGTYYSPRRVGARGVPGSHCTYFSPISDCGRMRHFASPRNGPNRSSIVICTRAR